MYYEDENNLYHYSYRKGDRVENVRDVDYTEVPPTQHKADPWEEKKPRKNRLGMKIAALALSCALVGGAAGAGITHYAALRAQVRRCWPRPWRARRTCRSSPSPARALWKCS